MNSSVFLSKYAFKFSKMTMALRKMRLRICMSMYMYMYMLCITPHIILHLYMYKLVRYIPDIIVSFSDGVGVYVSGTGLPELLVVSLTALM